MTKSGFPGHPTSGVTVCVTLCNAPFCTLGSKPLDNTSGGWWYIFRGGGAADNAPTAIPHPCWPLLVGRVRHTHAPPWVIRFGSSAQTLLLEV